ncbi:hypothetical protein EVAR_64350_1 [Eumeta japonica]|uniref:Uncharacterized protein n=1 Tax=Eumeta variegata TaxID=151549 RepID=A0A4C1ZM10_EUMVA|nr:hypothetical protein EVAR_64350_1 [Eumeta japonica]
MLFHFIQNILLNDSVKTPPKTRDRPLRIARRVPHPFCSVLVRRFSSQKREDNLFGIDHHESWSAQRVSPRPCTPSLWHTRNIDALLEIDSGFTWRRTSARGRCSGSCRPTSVSAARCRSGARPRPGGRGYKYDTPASETRSGHLQ